MRTLIVCHTARPGALYVCAVLPSLGKQPVPSLSLPKAAVPCPGLCIYASPSPCSGLASATILFMDQAQLNWLTSFIWNIADDVLRDVFVRGKYRDVILPMTVLRRLDAVLEPTKQAVLEMKAALDREQITNQDDALRSASGEAFYNTSPFLLRDLKSRKTQQTLKDDFDAYLDGFSPNVQDILTNFEFRNQIPRLSKADALGQLIEKFLDKDINLSPQRVGDQPGLDNHSMGTMFEELVRRFNEDNNEEAGEHWTPRDAVKLMANLIFLPIAELIESGTYLLYDGTVGTGGMLTVGEDWKVKVERPLRLHSQLTLPRIETLRYASGDEAIRAALYEELGEALFESPGSVRTALEKLVNEWGKGDSGEEEEEGEDDAPRKSLSDKKKRKLLNEGTWKRDAMLVDVATQLRKELGESLYEDHNIFLKDVATAIKKLDLDLSASELKLIVNAVSWRVEDAARVIKKVHKPGKTRPDPLHGFYEAEIDGKNCVVEYEPDSELRDFEQIPLLEEGGIEAFIRREVLPYTPDAWIVEADTKIGYEISFTRHFYQPPQLRTLTDISADILALEKETEGLLTEITRGVKA